MLDSSNKLEKSTMLFTLEKVGLCGQNLKKKKKRINFLLFLTLPPWYCIKDTCGMPINLVNTHVIFLLLEVTEWLKPRWILMWIQFFYLIPLLSREYGKLRKSSHLEDKKKKKKLWLGRSCSYETLFKLSTTWRPLIHYVLFYLASQMRKKCSLCWDILFHEIQHRISFFFMNHSNLTGWKRTHYSWFSHRTPYTCK